MRIRALFSLIVLGALLGAVPQKTSEVQASPANTLERWQPGGSYGGGFHALALDGDTLYLVEGLHLVVMQSFLDQSPVKIGQVELPTSKETLLLEYSQGTLFLLTDEPRWISVDVSDPSQPEVLEVHPLPTPVPVLSFEFKDFAVAGDYAYLLATAVYQSTGDETITQSWIEVLDVSDPSGAQHLGSLPAESGELSFLAVDGSALYAGGHDWDEVDGHFFGLYSIYDLTDPAQPQRQQTINLGDVWLTSFASADGVLVLGWNEALHLVDISDPANPRPAGSFDYKIPDYYTDLALTVQGQRAYLYGYTSSMFQEARLQVLDLSDPDNPALLGSLDDSYPFYYYKTGIASSGSRAYLVYPGGIKSFSVENPAQLQHGSWHLSYTIAETSAAGSYLVYAERHAFNADDALVVLDARDPLHPFEAARLEPGKGSISDLIVSGRRLYANTSYGLLVYDLGDPTAPLQVGEIPWSGWHHAAVEGQMAYISGYADQLGGYNLFIFDLSDPANPLLLASEPLSTTTSEGALSVSQGIVFYQRLSYCLHFAPCYYDLLIYDASDPQHPGLLAWHPVLFEVFSVIPRLELYGNTLYAWGSSLEVYDMSDPTNMVELPQSAVEYFFCADSHAPAAYLMDDRELKHMDMDDPLDLMVDGTLPLAVNDCGEIALGGGRLFLSDYKYGLTILFLPPGVYLPRIDNK